MKFSTSEFWLVASLSLGTKAQASKDLSMMHMKMMMGGKKKSSSAYYTDYASLHQSTIGEDFMVFSGYAVDDTECGGPPTELHGDLTGYCHDIGFKYWMIMSSKNYATDHTFMTYAFFNDQSCTEAAEEEDMPDFWEGHPYGRYSWVGCTFRENSYKEFGVHPGMPDFETAGPTFIAYGTLEDCLHQVRPLEFWHLSQGTCHSGFTPDNVGSILTQGLSGDSIALCDDHMATVTLYEEFDGTCSSNIAAEYSFEAGTCYEGSVVGTSLGYVSFECLH